jgi:hypothetical protein
MINVAAGRPGGSACLCLLTEFVPGSASMPKFRVTIFPGKNGKGRAEFRVTGYYWDELLALTGRGDR